MLFSLQFVNFASMKLRNALITQARYSGSASWGTTDIALAPPLDFDLPSNSVIMGVYKGRILKLRHDCDWLLCKNIFSHFRAIINTNRFYNHLILFFKASYFNIALASTQKAPSKYRVKELRRFREYTLIGAHQVLTKNTFATAKKGYYFFWINKILVHEIFS